MYERFTDRARKVMQLANQEAQRFSHEYIGTEHILLGLIKEGSGVAANVLKNLDIDLRRVRLEVEKIVTAGPDIEIKGKLPQTPRAKKVIEKAIEEARALNHNYVGTEHLLLGLLLEHEGVGAQVLMNLGLRLEDVRAEVLNILGHNLPREGQEAQGAGELASRTPTLDGYGLDLTEQARQGQIGPVFGRTDEVEQCLLVLSCRFQNSLLLVAEPGAGAPAVIQALAQFIAGGLCPATLRDCRLIALDLARLFMTEEKSEKVVRAIRAEVRKAQNIVLVLDDPSLLLSELSTYYLPRTLRTLFADDGARFIAIATPARYQKDLADGGPFTRFFQPVFVRPLTAEATVGVLRGQRDRLELHHRVEIRDDALEAAARLAGQLPDCCLPGTATRLLDQACAFVRLRVVGRPPDMEAIDAQIARLERDKEGAVAGQQFEQAAQLRDQADRLKQKKEQVYAEWLVKTEQAEAIVDAAAVAEVVRKMTGKA